jgi:hypothetical protein
MMLRFNKKQVIGCSVIGMTIMFSLVLVSIPSDTLLNYIGSDNAYLFMFLVAFVGSITTFAGIPYPLILLGLVVGGMNPVLAGLASAAGVIMADSGTFFAVRRGRGLLSTTMQETFVKVHRYIDQHPKLLTPGLLLYGTISPLSNDFAVISLSLMRYKYSQIILPLAVGSVIYNLGVALLGVYAYSWIVTIL